jgi:hypothetical protein
MATTTNYSWSTPDDVSLVKDGASAIRTLGSSADTTVKALNPGTTAGDIDYYTTSTAKARVGIGTAGQVLTVNSGATAPEWATVGGGFNKIVSASFSAAASVSINNCFTTTYQAYKIVLRNLANAATGPVYLQYQTSTNTLVSSNDYYGGGDGRDNNGNDFVESQNAADKFTFMKSVSANQTQGAEINFNNVGNSASDRANMFSFANGSNSGSFSYGGALNLTTLVTGIRFTGSGNLSGTYTVYGLA